MISYSKFSDRVFEYTYKWREKYFKPILKLLDKMRIKPNDITMLAFGLHSFEEVERIISFPSLKLVFQSIKILLCINL